MWQLDHKEGWALKNDAFELWCWSRLLRVPWTARRSNQSIIKEINPEDSLGRLMVKVKLQYFGHLMWRADSLEKTLMLSNAQEKKGATEDETVGWHHQLNGHEFEQTAWDSEEQGSLACCSPWGHKESDTTEQLNDNSFRSQIQILSGFKWSQAGLWISSEKFSRQTWVPVPPFKLGLRALPSTPAQGLQPRSPPTPRRTRPNT